MTVAFGFNKDVEISGSLKELCIIVLNNIKENPTQQNMLLNWVIFCQSNIEAPIMTVT